MLIYAYTKYLFRPVQYVTVRPQARCHPSEHVYVKIDTSAKGSDAVMVTACQCVCGHPEPSGTDGRIDLGSEWRCVRGAREGRVNTLKRVARASDIISYRAPTILARSRPSPVWC